MTKRETEPRLALPESRETLSTPELGNIIAAAGNHEGKALLLLAMQTGSEYGMSALHSLSVNIQGAEPAYEGRAGNQIKYADTMESVGLLAKSQILGNGLAYTKTALGADIGSATAGHLLTFSLRHPEVTLKDLFGSTQTSQGHRPAVNRIYILRAILANEPMTVSTLKRHCETDINAAVVTKIIKSLSTKKIIGFDYANIRRLPSLAFDFDATKINRSSTFPRPGASTNIALQIIEDAVRAGETSITKDILRQKFAEQLDQPDLTSKAVLRKLTSITDTFERNGILIPQNRYHNDRGELTNIFLTERQRDVLSELDNILRNLQNLDPGFLREGKQLASQILSDPDSVKILVKKCYGEESAKTNPLTVQTIGAELIALFDRLPEQSLSADDVIDYLKYKGHKTLEHYETTKTKLEMLAKVGKISLVHIKGEDHYVKHV